MRGVPVLLLLAAATAGLAQDRAITVDDRQIEGRLDNQEIAIEAEQGRLVIPTVSISSIGLSSDGTATVMLRNAQRLTGRLDVDEFRIAQELYSVALDPSEVRVIVLEKRPDPIPIQRGTRIPLELAEMVTSARANLDQPIRFCVSEDVSVGDFVPFPRGAPAFAEVTGTDTNRSLGRGDEVGIALRQVAARDGSKVPIEGTEELSGDYSVGSILTFGVFGLRGSGGSVRQPPGARITASVLNDTTVTSALSADTDADSWSYCEEYFRYQHAEYVPVEKLINGQAYAPLTSPALLSFPLPEPTVQTSVGARQILVNEASILNTLFTGKQRKKTYRFQFLFSIYVEESHDRWVELQLSLRAGEKLLGLGGSGRFEAEEEKTTNNVDVDLVVDRPALDEALRSGPTPRIWIEFLVRKQ